MKTKQSEELASRLREKIVRSRAIDEALAGLAKRGLVGMHAPATGYEGHIYGALAGLSPNDWLFGDPRLARIGLDRGQSLRDWLAQMLGLAGSSDLGHSTPGEHSARAGRVVSTSSLMGTQLGHAMGVGHAMRLRGEDACALAWFGPAAAATGDFHVALNFAAVYKTATVFYYCSSGDAAADEERIGKATMEARGTGYGIRVVSVDGGDPLAVAACVTEAALLARSGDGPTLIDGRTGSDPLESLGGDMPQVRNNLHAEIDTLVEELLAEGPPKSETLFAEVWAEMPSRLAEQQTQHLSHTARFSSGEVD
jgi:pyruvate dehydrogenase E1 component alpha subunit